MSNIVMIVLSTIGLVGFIAAVSMLIAAASILIEEDKKRQQNKPVCPPPSFTCFSRTELCSITASLIKKDRKRKSRRMRKITIV